MLLASRQSVFVFLMLQDRACSGAAPVHVPHRNVQLGQADAYIYMMQPTGSTAWL